MGIKSESKGGLKMERKMGSVLQIQAIRKIQELKETKGAGEVQFGQLS